MKNIVLSFLLAAGTLLGYIPLIILCIPVLAMPGVAAIVFLFICLWWFFYGALLRKW